tara:strand:+ start:1179 stop:1715 length:537 start_codon:yes stop_codon:yes gene_type:complete
MAEKQEAEVADLTAVTNALLNGSESQKAALRQALGVGGAITRPKKRVKKQTNAQAKNLAMAGGEVQHPDLANGEPWSPKPSEAMVANLEDYAIRLSEERGKVVSAVQLATAIVRKKHMESDTGGVTTTMTAREAEERYGLDSVDPDDLAMIAQEEFTTDIETADFSDIGFAAEEGSVG